MHARARIHTHKHTHTHRQTHTKTKCKSQWKTIQRMQTYILSNISHTFSQVPSKYEHRKYMKKIKSIVAQKRKRKNIYQQNERNINETNKQTNKQKKSSQNKLDKSNNINIFGHVLLHTYAFPPYKTCYDIALN